MSANRKTPTTPTVTATATACQSLGGLKPRSVSVSVGEIEVSVGLPSSVKGMILWCFNESTVDLWVTTRKVLFSGPTARKMSIFGHKLTMSEYRNSQNYLFIPREPTVSMLLMLYK